MNHRLPYSKYPNGVYEYYVERYIGAGTVSKVKRISFPSPASPPFPWRRGMGVSLPNNF